MNTKGDPINKTMSKTKRFLDKETGCKLSITAIKPYIVSSKVQLVSIIGSTAYLQVPHWAENVHSAPQVKLTCEHTGKVPVLLQCPASYSTNDTTYMSVVGIGPESYRYHHRLLHSGWESPCLGSPSEIRLRNRT